MRIARGRVGSHRRNRRIDRRISAAAALTVRRGQHEAPDSQRQADVIGQAPSWFGATVRSPAVLRDALELAGPERRRALTASNSGLVRCATGSVVLVHEDVDAEQLARPDVDEKLQQISGGLRRARTALAGDAGDVASAVDTVCLVRLALYERASSYVGLAAPTGKKSFLLQREARELRSRRDFELREDAAEVGVDRAW